MRTHRPKKIDISRRIARGRPDDGVDAAARTNSGIATVGPARDISIVEGVEAVETAADVTTFQLVAMTDRVFVRGDDFVWHRAG